MATEYWAVDYFQLNAAQDAKGESAIVLLVLKDIEVVKPIGTVKSAVLIDAGNGLETAELIKKAITNIECSYAGYKVDPLAPVRFKFDAVVLTHWDEDHYRGFMHFLQRWEAEMWDDNGQFLYFKYDNSTEPGVPGTPLTRLYCSITEYPKPPDNSGKGFGYKNTARLDRSADSGSAMRWNVNTASYSYSNALAGAAGVQYVLGTNVFTGKGLASPTTWATIRNPLALVNANDPSLTDIGETWSGAPGFYIVGAESQYLGNTTDVVSIGLSRSEHNIRTRDDVGVVNTPPSRDTKNANCLVLLLMWRNLAKPLTVPPQVQLYTGGDAEWIAENKTANFVKPGKIQVIKAGHHGSAAGTSTYFIENANPDYYLISNGTQHGHPVPEVLLYLDSWFSGHKSNAIKRIYSVCYPYHLGWVSDSSATPPVVRYFRNLLTEPDLLTTEVKNLPDMSSNDKLYVPFIADLQLAYQGLKIDPSPIDEFTTDVRQMIANKSPDLATPVQLAQEKYLESKTANNRTALDRVKKPFSLQKAQLLAPRLTKIWTKWSQIQYQHFPSQAFTSGDVPKELVIIDWIFATFSCDASSDPDQDTLNAKMDPVERESKKPSEGEPSSKYVKTSLNNDFISNGKDVVSKAHSIQLLGASGLGTVKRKLTPRRCVSQVTQFLLSVDEENTIERQETEGDDLVPNPAYDPDNNSYWYKLENVQILQRKSTATTVVPSKIYPSDGPTEAGCINLDDASNYDYFVAALEGACLSLSAKALNSGWQGNPDGNDKLLMWIQAFFVDPSGNITMSWSGTSISPYTLAVQLNFELPANSSPVNVTYSSQWSIIKTAFDIQTENQDLVDVNGFYNASTGVVLGIDFNEASAAASMTVKQVFQLLEIPLFPLLDETIALGIHGGSGTSSGVWICPDDNNLIAWRMTLMGTSNQAIEQAYMKSKLPGLTFQNSVIVVTKEGYLQMASSNGAAAQTNMICTGSVSIQATASLNGNPSSSWSTYITLGSNTANLILRWTSASNSPIDDLFQWLGSADGPNLPVQNAYASFKGLLDKLEFHLREFSITADYDASGWHFSACAVVFELDLAWGVPANSDARVPVRLSLAYLASAGSVPFVKFDGEIWQSMVDTDLERLIPGALPYPLLTPDTLHPQDYISLLDMDGIADDVKTNFPRTVVPTYVTALSLTLQSGVNGGISFNGIMQSAEPLQTSSWLQFDRVSVDASYNSELSSVTFGFSAEINLTPRTELEVGMAVLSIDVEYDSNAGWTIEGTVRDLNIGCLYSLFPDADNEAVMNVMENITVSYLGITYDYGQNDFAFAIEGFIELGDIELELLFTRNSSLWEFSATLSSDFSSTGVTLGSVLDGLSSDLSSSLPDFVSGINFTIPTNSFIKLECTKVSSSDNVNGYVILGLIAQVGDFSFSFVQISSGASSDSDGGPNNQAPKRLLKFTMGRLPVVEDVPLLDSLTQPFDSMNFLYASDDFTRDEVNNIVSVVYNGATDQLVYKDPRLETNDPTIVDPGKDILKDKVLRAGCHFQIVVELENQPTPVLDYVFGGPQPPPASFKSPYSWSIEDPPSAPTSAGTATAPWTKTLGPLTINAISLECVGSELNITLDAAVQLGPLSGNVKGFTIAVPLNTLPDLRGISVSLEGIGLEMNRPPVCIAGELVKNSDGSFQGGVALSVEPYLFLAGGYYDDKVENPNNSGTFKSLFVFAELDGPIAEFEFASISGLQGGVGYNSQIMLPTVDSVSSFPFIASSTKDQPSIKAVLDFYMKGSFITPADGPCWIAAGLTVKAFQTLLIKAVIVVDLSDDVRFGIFADVLANIPASAANDSELFARIDMSLLAVIDPAKGTFRAEGQLTPKSFVLDQNCHLLGGFALCYWFEGSGHDGDWVFTVGGYHSAYSPPLWYPRPPRLSISWQYDSDLSIYGEAYFAITPKVCMGGGALKLNYHAGDVQVDFNAYADFLINYSPFTFIADVGVNLNIKYTLDLYFVTKRFDVHFGARLDLWGPPVAGVVHIEWSILTFDIYFGNSNLQQGPLSWSEFSALLRQESGESKPNEDSDQGLHAIAATSGILSNNNNPSSEIYSQGTETMLVDSSTFSFRFTSLFPLTSVTFAAGQRIGPAISVPATYIKPMQIQSTASVKGDLNVTIQDAQGNDGIFLFQLIQKQVPTALWSAYNPSTDPSSGTTIASLLSPTDATVAQTMAVQFIAPNPADSADWIQFDVDLGSSLSFGTPALPGPESVPPAIMPLATFDAAVNLWAPLTVPRPYAPRTILGRIEMPQIAAKDVVQSWMQFCDVTPDTPLGTALTALEADTGYAPNWLDELYSKPAEPLALLSAEATMEAVLVVPPATRFADTDYSAGAPGLWRDFLDGGYVGEY